MDVEKRKDCRLIAVASAFISDGFAAKVFDDLQREAVDIYALVYHPSYIMMTDQARGLNGMTQRDILQQCLSSVNEEIDETRLRYVESKANLKEVSNKIRKHTIL